MVAGDHVEVKAPLPAIHSPSLSNSCSFGGGGGKAPDPGVLPVELSAGLVWYEYLSCKGLLPDSHC